MAVSTFFHNFENSQEQQLIEALVVESIQIYGHDVLYLPRTVVNRDSIFTEPEFERYDEAIIVDMYIRNVDDFAGEGVLLSKFGMEIRDQITFVVAQRTFADEVSTYTTRRRPLEGDLIFMPMTDAVYQIQYVNEKAIFYQMGALQTYDLTCELFEYSSQIFNTGYPSIDDKYNALSIISSNYHILDTTGSFVITGTGGERIIYTDYNIDTIDVQAQNEEMETEADLFLDFSESNPFGEHV